MSLIYLFNDITKNYADEFKGKEEEFAIRQKQESQKNNKWKKIVVMIMVMIMGMGMGISY